MDPTILEGFDAFDARQVNFAPTCESEETTQKHDKIEGMGNPHFL
jgi:hypothetical protein